MTNWSNATSPIIGPDGKPILSDQYLPCPSCGRKADQRIQSAGFGKEIHMMCPCGYDFQGRFKCPNPIV